MTGPRQLPLDLAGEPGMGRDDFIESPSNAAALAIACGPAVVVGLVALRDHRLWRVVGGALAAVALAALIGLSKGEVERIWLPFTVWLLAAGAVAVQRWGPSSLRWWLGAQVAVALAVQTIFRTGW